MSWTAVVPFKGYHRKTRLRSRLTAEQCRSLSEDMFTGLIRVLCEVPALSEIILLSDVQPKNWEHGFLLDKGHGLNFELAALVTLIRPARLIVVHADLPLICAEDIGALLGEETQACTIAPDRKLTGTNALALTEPLNFPFAFGLNSLAKHQTAAQGGARIVARLGLALDIDTEEDLDDAVALGFRPQYDPQFNAVIETWR